MSASKKLLYWISGPRLPLLNLVAAVVTCGVVMARRDWAFSPKPDGSDPALAYLLDIIARVSVVYFLLVFYARPLNEVFHNKVTRFMVKNRRYIGLSFAAWFLQHLWILPTWGYPVFHKFWMAGRLGFATITVLLIVVQTLTSFNRAQRSLPGWKAIHWISLQANWVWFLAIYILFWEKRGEPYQLVYVVLFIGGQLLRIVLFSRKLLRDRASGAPLASERQSA